MVSKARNVRIMTEVLSKEDLNTLMASVDVLVSLHRSEGYGLVLLEMLMLGKPVIATGYSGNMQFMSKLPIEFQFLQIPYAYIPVNVSEHFQKVYTSDQRWADPDVEAAAKAMYKLYSDPALLQRCRTVLGPLFREQFGPARIGEQMRTILELSAENLDLKAAGVRYLQGINDVLG